MGIIDAAWELGPKVCKNVMVATRGLHIQAASFCIEDPRGGNQGNMGKVIES